jgi:hypothetical protein
VPGEAKVYVESFYKTWYKRFPFGTVAATKQPSDSRLEGAEQLDFVRFRTKVVDTSGKILAEADGILPSEAESAQSQHRCILFVNFVDLGERIWNLDYDPGQVPALEVNVNIPQIGSQIRDLVKTPRFAPLVYPAAIKELLLKILENDYDEEDVDSPETQWLEFVRRFYSTPPPQGEELEAREDWAGEAVRAFCEKYGLATSFGSGFGAST